jgi:hypothetical protein
MPTSKNSFDRTSVLAVHASDSLQATASSRCAAGLMLARRLVCYLRGVSPKVTESIMLRPGVSVSRSPGAAVVDAK